MCATGRSADGNKDLEVAKQPLNYHHPSGFFTRESGCETIEIAVLRIIASRLRPFDDVPSRPDSGCCQLVSFGDAEWRKMMMRGAPLIGIFSPDPIDQTVNIENTAVCEKEILAYGNAYLGKCGRDVLIHQPIPDIPQ
jgi:hypothetical protein